jgi:hypothetical protein
MYGGRDVIGGIDELLEYGVPSGVWQFLWPAFVVGDLVAQFCNQVCIMVREGIFTGDLLTGVPITLVEKEVRGKMSTLLAVWAAYGPVSCVMKAYMAFSIKTAQITMKRAGYVEDAIDDITGEGYRRVVWPTLEAPEGPGSWPHIAPRPMNERTIELLCKAVFSLE